MSVFKRTSAATPAFRRSPGVVSAFRRTTPGIWAVALAVFVASALFRFLEFGFHNDHFEFMALGTEIVNGAVPGIDFFDSSRPLQQYLSAAGLWLFGHQLLAEAVFCVGVLSVAAAVVFLLGVEITGAISLGLVAAAFVVAMLPRLYSYPKIIVPAVGLLACWRYTDRPSEARLAAVSLVTAVAFYLRFDYGGLFGIAVGSALIVRHLHWRSLAAAMVQYGSVVVLLCAPYVLLQATRGVLASGPASGRLAHLLSGDDVISLGLPSVPGDRPLVSVRPSGPLATVRWRADAPAARRSELERQYSLRRVDAVDAEAWRYVLLDRSPSTLARLVADPSVSGVTNVDSEGRVLREPAWSVVRRWLHVPVVEFPFLTEATAAVWLYDVIFLTPLLAAAALAVRYTRGRSPEGELPKIVATIVLGVLFNIFLIRGNLDSRLPDVIVPAALLWVWMARVFVSRPEGRRLPGMRIGIAVMTLLAVWLCVDAYARSVIHLEATELFSSPRRAAGRLAGTIRSLRGEPLESFAPAGSRGLPALTRYVNRCTRPSDYLLVLGYQPEIYFYANRRIGGGNAYYHANLASAPEQQQTIVSRLRRQSVPIVILPVNEVAEFEASYPIVKRYIDERYVLATESGFGEGRPFRVLVDRGAVSTHRDLESDLPCFSD